MKQRCIEMMKALTGKRYIFFTDRGNSSIRLAVEYAASIGHKRIYIPDQGGWLTYPKYAKKSGLEIRKIETDLSYIDAQKLDMEEGSAAILNSMAGYIALLDMKRMTDDNSSCFIINDASGSIGTDAAKHGDIIIGSFGEWKPLNVGYGGFIATDDERFIYFFEQNFNVDVKGFYDGLYSKLEGLDKRLIFLQRVREGVLEDMKIQDVVHKDKRGIDVVVRFSDEREKQKLINYCEERGFEHTLCPREIRVMCDAVSIEIKRLEGE